MQFNWNDALGFSPDDLEDLRNFGYAYLTQGKFNVALPIFEGLAILSAESSYDNQTLGAIYLEMSRNFEALKHTDLALKADPTNSDALINRAKALVSMGCHKQCRKLAEQLLTHPDPKVSSQASALMMMTSKN